MPTQDELFDDFEDNGDEVNDLMPDGLVDPELTDIDDLQDDEAIIGGLDDLTDPEEDEDGNEEGVEEGEDNNVINEEDIVIVENDVINEILAAKGIKDPKALKYENEQGEVVDVDFYGLPYEEQLEILKSNTNALSEHENEVVNFLRTQKATLDDVIAYAQRQAVEDYIKETEGENFEVDDYNDEELYVMNLKLHYEDWSDEDLQLELEKELQHPELFKRKVDRLRQEYVALETQNKESRLKEEAEVKEVEFKQLSHNLIEAAIATEDIGGLTLADADKNVVLSSVLEKDMNGLSKVDKAMKDPNLLFKMAWFIEKGDEAFQLIHDYYKKQIDATNKAAYAKGKNESTKTTQTKTSKMSFTRPATAKSNNTNQAGVKTIDDLY